MDWPIMVDPFNLLHLPLVPVTLLLDEHGVIRLLYPRMDKVAELEAAFINQQFDPPPDLTSPPTTAPNLDALHTAAQDNGGFAWRDYAVALALWGGANRLDEAIDAAQRSLNAQNDDRTHFYLGVMYRKRFDSPYRQAHDFQNAVDHWTQALNIDPNNYIWRRRIQQYGPRLDKPYPFYDWVPTAREEIQARGQTPVELTVEPGGAEFAHPVSAFDGDGAAHDEPDAESRIHQDQEGFVQVETTIVPPAVVPGDSARVHITLRPNVAQKAHWNNEAGDLVLWVNGPEGWQIEHRLLTLPNPPTDVSQETRHLEFEVRPPENTSPGTAVLSAYTLYYVCEDINGVCLYRRQDIPLHLEVKESQDIRRLRDGG